MNLDGHDDELFDAIEASIQERVEQITEGPLRDEARILFALARALAMQAGVALAAARQCGEIEQDEYLEAVQALRFRFDRSSTLESDLPAPSGRPFNFRALLPDDRRDDEPPSIYGRRPGH